MALLEHKPISAEDRLYLKKRRAQRLARNHPADTFKAYRIDVARRCRKRDEKDGRRD